MRPGHEDSGRYAFIRDITDQYTKLIISQTENIVEIASHLASGENAPTEIEAFVQRQNVWRDRHLNIGRNLKLPLEPFFFNQLLLRSFEFIKGLLKLSVLFR